MQEFLLIGNILPVASSGPVLVNKLGRELGGGQKKAWHMRCQALKGRSGPGGQEGWIGAPWERGFASEQSFDLALFVEEDLLG